MATDGQFRKENFYTEPYNELKQRQLQSISHVIGFYDQIGLWVMKIKKPMIFACVVRRDHVNRAQQITLYSMLKVPYICLLFV